jgi:hypothetical protein
MSLGWHTVVNLVTGLAFPIHLKLIRFFLRGSESKRMWFTPARGQKEDLDVERVSILEPFPLDSSA